MKRGVVTGKFYPPHAGHTYLIDFASAHCDRVQVLVCDGAAQEPTATLRAGWLRQMHPDVTVDVIPDIHDDDNSVAWARHTLQFIGYTPDIVFGSEPYIAPWAAAMGCEGIIVDQARTVFPISGTAVRANPYAHWEYLHPVVRAHFVRRVCLIGAESAGKTTMARLLALHYKTAWVPEYGRVYSDRVDASGKAWRTEDFVHIAREQQRREDEAARQANRVLICDTDAFTTALWHEAYMGHRSPVVETIANRRTYDAYLFMDTIGIPFEQDGTRDLSRRAQMETRFRTAFYETGREYHLLTGTHEERIASATCIIDRLIRVRDHTEDS